MRPVNLIPADERRGESAPTRTGPLVYVLVGALALTLVAVYLVVSTGNSIAERKAEVVTLEQDLASAQARVTALSGFASFAALEQSRALTVSSLARSRFDWERVLRELALVIPPDVSLDSLSGTVSGESGEGAASSGGIGAPTLTMTGCAESHESVAGLIAALRDIDGVTRVGLSSSEKGSAEATATASSSSSESGADCPPEVATFDLVAAFDEVAVSPDGAGIVPSESSDADPGA